MNWALETLRRGIRSWPGAKKTKVTVCVHDVVFRSPCRADNTCDVDQSEIELLARREHYSRVADVHCHCSLLRSSSYIDVFH